MEIPDCVASARKRSLATTVRRRLLECLVSIRQAYIILECNATLVLLRSTRTFLSALKDGAPVRTILVDAGVDPDFGKPRPQYKIHTPPFYAAWATPLVHDTRAGLRINAQCQVMDMQGEVIPGLYCGGESAGGFNQHGLVSIPIN